MSNLIYRAAREEEIPPTHALSLEAVNHIYRRCI